VADHGNDGGRGKAGADASDVRSGRDCQRNIAGVRRKAGSTLLCSGEYLSNLKINFRDFALNGKSTYHFCENPGTFCAFLSSVAGNQRKVPDMAYGQQDSGPAFAFCSGD
jgi:hypothetical protein